MPPLIGTVTQMVPLILQNGCTGDLTVDCANGVGAPKLKELAKLVSTNLKIHVVNDGSAGILNEGCGADFVKIQQRAPNGKQALKL